MLLKQIVHLSRKVLHFVAILLCIACSPISLILRLLGYRVFVTGTMIGHFTIEPETYLRELKLKGLSSKKVILFPPFKPIISKQPCAMDSCNPYLTKLWKQQFIVITSPLLALFLYPILGGPFLRKPQIFKSHFLCYYPNYWIGSFSKNKGLFDFQGQYYQKYPEFGPEYAVLNIPEEDRKIGWRALASWGLKKGDWFVCFNIREPGHYTESNLKQESLRNADIETYYKSLEEIVRRGGWCIRVGSSKTKPLPKRFKQLNKVIDYPHTEHHSAFMDIFLCASCKFFLGGASGITLVSGLFGVPSVVANLVPIGVLPPYPKDIAVQKLYYSHKKSRLLSPREIFSTNLSTSHCDQDFIHSGVELVDNTEEEIYEAVLEMFDQLEGKNLNDPISGELNNKFKSMIPEGAWGKNFAGKIGKHFLTKYAAAYGLNEQLVGENSQLLSNH